MERFSRWRATWKRRWFRWFFVSASSLNSIKVRISSTLGSAWTVGCFKKINQMKIGCFSRSPRPSWSNYGPPAKKKTKCCIVSFKRPLPVSVKADICVWNLWMNADGKVFQIELKKKTKKNDQQRRTTRRERQRNLIGRRKRATAFRGPTWFAYQVRRSEWKFAYRLRRSASHLHTVEPRQKKKG